MRARDEKIKAQAKPASKPSLANLSQYDRAQSAPPGIIDGKFAGARGMASPSFLEQEPARYCEIAPIFDIIGPYLTF